MSRLKPGAPRPWALAFAVVLAGGVAACGGDGGGGGPTGTASVAGIVTNGHTGTPVQGAVVRVGSAQATTDASGAYALANLSEGAAIIRSELPGFVTSETNVTLASGSNTLDIAMTREETFRFAPYALHAPAGVATVRAVIVVLGGPNTTGFATGERISPATATPQVEASAQALAGRLRTLAADSSLAVMGTTQIALPDEAATDQALAQALANAATAAGRPELATAPVILLGISAGAPPTWGFASRNPARVAGAGYYHPYFNMRTAAPPWSVPAMMWLGELDAIAPPGDGVVLFQAGRAEHALWAGGVEPGVGHADVTSTASDAIVSWFTAIVGARLPAAAGGSLRGVSEDSGWLGNLATGEIAPFASFTGDPATAAWLPSEAAANSWKFFVGL